MKTKYSIEEILNAVNELNNDSKLKKEEFSKKNTLSLDKDIPINTLRLIEEAEKNKD